jgi:aminopeptidase 2
VIQDRVLYEPKRVQLLGSQAYQSNSPFNVTDRIGLVSDAMALAKSGMALTSAGLSLINEMKKETECTFWVSHGIHFTRDHLLCVQ